MTTIKSFKAGMLAMLPMLPYLVQLLCAIPAPLVHDALQRTDVCCFRLELRKDYVKRAPPVVGEVGGPVRSLAAPVLNIAQANNARGEGRVRRLCNVYDQMHNMSQSSLASASCP